VRVFNTTAAARVETTEVKLDVDIGTQSIRVFDTAGNAVPCQFVLKRKYLPHNLVANLSEHSQVQPSTEGLKPSQQWRHADAASPITSRGESRQWRSGDPDDSGTQELLAGESLNAGVLLFPTTAPPLGYATYRIEPVYRAEPAPQGDGARAEIELGGTIRIETDRYRVRIDPRRGGAFNSIFDKELRTEFVDTGNERLFNEYSGYFINEKHSFDALLDLRKSVQQQGQDPDGLHILDPKGQPSPAGQGIAGDLQLIDSLGGWRHALISEMVVGCHGYKGLYNYQVSLSSNRNQKGVN
jgi:hypothetical protein